MHSRFVNVRRLLTAGAVTVLFAASASAAQADTATSHIGPLYTSNGLGSANYGGGGVGLNSGWTYSWILKLTKYGTGTAMNDHQRLNFVPGSSFTTPNYQESYDPRVWGTHYCATMNIHHGSTLATTLTATYTSCNDLQAFAPSVNVAAGTQ
jgi:hypothetical protein